MTYLCLKTAIPEQINDLLSDYMDSPQPILKSRLQIIPYGENR